VRRSRWCRQAWPGKCLRASRVPGLLPWLCAGVQPTWHHDGVAAAVQVFVSYRRNDDPGAAVRIADALSNEFGDDNVFFDVDEASPTAGDLLRVVAAGVIRADVVVAVIGTGWLDELASRATDDRDYVRNELSLALRLQKLVCPVLVNGAGQPTAKELPSDLHALLHHHVLSIDTRRGFRPAMRAVIDTLASQTLQYRVEVDSVKPTPEHQRQAAQQFADILAEFQADDRTDWGQLGRYFTGGIIHDFRAWRKAQKADDAFAAGDYETALQLSIDEFETSWLLSTGIPLIRGAKAALRLGRLKAALRLATAAYELDHEDGNLGLRGEIRHRLGDITGAISDLDQAIAARHQTYDSMRSSSSPYSDTELQKVADELFHLRVMRANCAYDLGRYDESVELNQALVADTPEPPAFLLANLGEALFCAGRVPEALESFDAARRIDATARVATMGAIVCRIVLGDIDAPLRKWRQLAAADPHLADSRSMAERFNWADPLYEKLTLLARLLPAADRDCAPPGTRTVVPGDAP
jgi:tetratricopeptide (TPR) repeat protein